MVGSRCFAGGRRVDRGRLKSSCRGHQMAGSAHGKRSQRSWVKKTRKMAIASGNADGYPLARGAKGEPYHEEQCGIAT